MIDPRRRALEALAGGAYIPMDVEVSPVGASDLRPPTSDLVGAPSSVVGAREGVASGEPQAGEVADHYARALDQQRANRLGAGLSRAGAGIIEAISGAPADKQALSNLDEQAGDPVVEYLQRQKMADDKRRTELSGVRKGGKSTDPNSPESKAAQARLRVNFPSLSDEDLANVTEASEHDFGVLRGQGMGQLQRAGDKAADLGEKAKDRKIREQELALKREAFEQGRNEFASMLGYKYEDLDFERQKLVDQLAEARASRAQAASEKVDAQSKDFGTAYTDSGLPDFYEHFEKASALFAKYPKSLPGVGIAAGRVPSRFSSTDAKVLRAVAGQMLQAYKKSVTGLGSSAKEDEAIQNATGLIQTGDDESIRVGVGILKDVMDAKADALKSGYKPEAVEAVTGRLKRAPDALTRKPTPAAHAAPSRPQQDEEALAWARENPDDPRAAQILTRLGVAK